MFFRFIMFPQFFTNLMLELNEYILFSFLPILAVFCLIDRMTKYLTDLMILLNDYSSRSSSVGMPGFKFRRGLLHFV